MAQPKEALAPKTKSITINSNYKATEQNVKISAGDSIEFTSQANQACSVSFIPAGVFANQTVPDNGSAPAQSTSSNQTPITVDYSVVGPNETTGPYSITIDDGALPMTVDSYGNCDFDSAAIPNNGTLYFTYNQVGPNPPATITVEFTTPNGKIEFFENGQGVTSQVLSPGSNNELQGRGDVDASYSFTGTTQPRQGGGGGTIKVGSGG